MALSPEYRNKLNTIIGKMKANNESDDSIVEMVSQFKTKYDVGGIEESPIEEPTLEPRLETTIPSKGMQVGLGEERRVPESIARPVRGATAGLAQGLSLGGASLIPPAKEAISEAKEEAPGAYAAGDIASYMIPGTGQAKLFKAGQKAVTKAIPKIAGKIGGKMLGAGIGSGLTEGIRGTLEEGSVEEGLKRGAVGTLAGAGSTGLMLGGEKLMKYGGKKILQQVLPLRKYVKKGLKVEHIDELGVAATTLKGTGEKVTKRKAQVGKKIDDILTKQQPDVRFNPETAFVKLEKNIYDIDKAVGFEKQVVKAAKKIYNDTLKPRGLTGKDLSANDFRKVKKLLDKIAFEKDIAIKAADPNKVKAAKILYFDMMDDMADKIPEIVKLNKTMHKLMVIDDMVEEAIQNKEVAKMSIHNVLNVIRVGGLVGGGIATTKGEGKLGAGLVGASMLSHPRGAAALKLAGKTLGTEGLRRGAAAVTTRGVEKLLPEEEEEEEKINMSSISKFRGQRGLR